MHTLRLLKLEIDMLRHSFVEKTTQCMDHHLKAAWRRHRHSAAVDQLYPTHLIIMEMQNHYAFELAGCSPTYCELRVKLRKSFP